MWNLEMGPGLVPKMALSKAVITNINLPLLVSKPLSTLASPLCPIVFARFLGRHEMRLPLMRVYRRMCAAAKVQKPNFLSTA